LRIKEQETHLTLQGHDDDDDDISSNSGHPQGKNRYILEGTEACSDSFVCNANQLHLIHIMKIQNGKYSSKEAILFNK